jgi:hypothetical protein
MVHRSDFEMRRNAEIGHFTELSNMAIRAPSEARIGGSLRKP